LSELNDPKPFRARAYVAAARALEVGSFDLASLAAQGKLTGIPGVGAGIAETIRELVETGQSTVHEELRTAIPAGVYDLLKVPGLGPRKVRTLHEELGIETLDDLERAVGEGRVSALAGFGAKTAERVISGIAFVREGVGRLRYPDAQQVAERLIPALLAAPGVQRVEAAGGLRRLTEVVDEVVLVAAAVDPKAVWGSVPVLEGLAEETARVGITLAGRLVDGARLRVHLVPPAAFAAALLVETGSDAHLAELRDRAAAAGVELEPTGESGPADEDSLYGSIGSPWIPPELREGMGEVEDAIRHGVPELIRVEDLRGTFHCHTTYSDGKATLAQMAEGARARGWSYLGIADHSQSAAYAGGLSPQRVAEQLAEIAAWNRSAGATRTGGPGRGPEPGSRGAGAGVDDASRPDGTLRLFGGIESDILADGSLDYPDEVLARFDYVVGSVHSGFRMSREEMTERVIRAVRNPYLTILGHPTGRRLLTRGGYSLDVRAVLDAAAEAGVIVEINANPHRLDLDWRELRYAVDRGVLIAINPDAHSEPALDDVRFGVNMARKGALSPRHVINSWSLREVEDLFAGRKARIESGS
jgi:DNA polymerase (family X)